PLRLPSCAVRERSLAERERQLVEWERGRAGVHDRNEPVHRRAMKRHADAALLHDRAPLTTRGFEGRLIPTARRWLRRPPLADRRRCASFMGVKRTLLWLGSVGLWAAALLAAFLSLFFRVILPRMFDWPGSHSDPLTWQQWAFRIGLLAVTGMCILAAVTVT